MLRAFLSAGIDTTVFGLGNVLHLLARHPDAYDKLRADPELLRAAIDEAMRVEPVAQQVFRTTARETALGGATLADNYKVMLLIGSSNRDPRQWPNADTFDIERRPRGTLTFGAGIHGCVGQVIARLEIEALLTVLMKRVRRFHVAGTPELYLNNTLRGLATLPLAIETA
nr:cytochrome P450 [Variovorax sp. HW608]